MQAHILIVDDDARIRRMIERFLTSEGLVVSCAGSLSEARRAVATTPPDIALVDLNLGGEDGLALARELGQVSRIGVIILSGKTSAIDRIVGLEIGADDYVTKPFDLRELLARIRAVLRRLQQRPQPATAETPLASSSPVFRFGDWRYDADRHRLVASDGVETPLTTAEHRLFTALLGHPHRILDRDRLMDVIAGRSWSPLDRAIDTQVRRLRVKLMRAGLGDDLIQTVRGSGYMLCVDVARG